MTEQDEWARRASVFGTRAAAYATYRPGYPAAFREWALAPVLAAGEPAVLDLAAGTGKLTESLLGHGVTVTAVEPDPAMLAQLTELFPDVPALKGNAEEIPLPDSSVSAVLVGQALHWFDLDRALPEIARVLRPGGSLVVVWNAYDDRVPWLDALCGISGMVRWTVEREQRLDPRLADFGEVEHTTFPNWIIRTVDTLLATTATSSGLLVRTPEERDRILAEVRQVLEADPGTAHGEFAVPMVSNAFRVTPR